jgi:tRNA A37 threonylcarbamoyladenosine dehydratase
MKNLNQVIGIISRRKEEVESYICQMIANITPEAVIETMSMPLSEEEIHYQTIIGVSRVPVVSLTIYISRDSVIDAIDSKTMKVNLIINIEETCPEVYREPLEKALDLDRRDKKIYN